MPEVPGTLKPPRLASAPSSPVAGQMYFDTVLNKMQIWDGTLWGSTDLKYLGDWVAGTYQEGDIVVYGGIAYLAVRQTSATPVAWTAGQAGIPYATTLPGSPGDGMLAILVDSITNPSWEWNFRYNAGSSSAYKWEFIGGSPMRKLTTTPEALSAGSYGDLATVDNLLIPRAGDYRVDFGVMANSATATENVADAGIFFGGTGPAYPIIEIYCPTVQFGGTGSAAVQINGQASSTDFRIKYTSPTGRSITWRNRWLNITPIRVS